MPDLTQIQELTNSVKSRLTHETAVEALDHYLASHRAPAALLRTLEAIAEGHTSRPLGWHRVSWGLVEMLASGLNFTPILLRAFAAKVELPQSQEDNAASSDALLWERLIVEWRLSFIRTLDEATATFNAMASALNWQVGERERRWRQLSAIAPTSAEYRAKIKASDRIAFIEKRLHDVE